MATVEVKCGECGHAQEIDRKQLGTALKCPKCKDSFIAEAGDTYALAREPRPSPPSRPASSSPGPAGNPATGRKPSASPDPEVNRQAEQLLDRWATDLDE